ncbi:chemotaxis protein CheA [Caproiciproducens sp. MSJ-32]|uniref:chemotaxis protein CheA n=1 Tax=Caproiciproducens sp. MSJ-32 TaxID=2841527 RepID=UPI001C0FFF5D|nr:chemotaxis protein CheA [Caproiciproducens sp. MSJ-32]MBU5454626.1 chemotaxis protein CheA [Caproiciproducens sp. MSJ-32]
MDVSQYMGMFLEESMENLQTLNEALLDLEQNPKNKDKLNEIFRVAHTIKGMAATMGFSDIAELTHKMEDVLSEFREGKLEVTSNVVTILFECLDTLERMVSNIEQGSDETIDITEVMRNLESVANEENIIVETEGDAKAEPAENNEETTNTLLNEYDISVLKQGKENGFNGIDIKITLREDILLKSARAFLIVQELETQGEIIKSYPSTEDIENEQFDTELYFVLVTVKTKEEIEEIVKNISEVEKVVTKYVELKEDINKLPEIPKAKEIEKKTIVNNKNTNSVKNIAKKEKSSKRVHQSVRVDLDRIDKLMNMVSELVIYRTRLEQIVIDNKSQELVETIEQVERTTSDLQDLVMKIRMLPLEVVFNRFPRLIRDISVDLNKEINFIIEGSETELDRTVIDEIGEPLIHLLRNAADHGIESREERIAAGKDPVGTIKLVAYQEGTKALIKVEDDGAGINLAKVKAKAEKMGINTEGLSDNDIRNLIFNQGFSTNTEVTDISGRGVGMDVVKTKISALGGTVDVVSEEGKGSSFIIKLPLTLQIIQALLVKVGSQTFAISLGYIDKVIDYKEDRIKKTNGEEVIVYRDTIIPLIRLNERLGIEKADNKKKFVIIVKVGDKVVGLLVDSLLGQQEIVIKPLGDTLKSLKEYIGATILGNGLVTLILDVAALI